MLDCALEMDGLRAVLAALETLQAALQSLELGGNGELAVQGATLLRDFFLCLAQACPVLQTLELNCNEIESAGAAAVLRNRVPSSQTLTLIDNLEFPMRAAQRLQQVYDTVEVDDELDTTTTTLWTKWERLSREPRFEGKSARRQQRQTTIKKEDKNENNYTRKVITI